MKKVLLATTVLAMTAPLASAEGLTLSGYGRFGLDYLSDRDADLGGGSEEEEAQINARMRINIDGSVETDSGITFGGRTRIQWSSGSTSSSVSPALLYAEASGFRVEVGNANTAYDSVNLMYNSEIGYLDRGFGDPNGRFYSFESTSFGAESDRMGLFVGYSVGGFNGRVSIVDPDQSASSDDSDATADESETSISVDYDFGQFTVAAAYVDNALGFDGDTGTFVGAEYAINDAANVGLLYFDFDYEDPALEDSTRVTLYGNYTFDAFTLKGYVATDDEEGLENDVAGGIGVDYDLGGARLAFDLHRDYSEQTIAGLGVRFDF